MRTRTNTRINRSTQADTRAHAHADTRTCVAYLWDLLTAFVDYFRAPRVPQIVRNAVVFGLCFAPKGATGFPTAHFGANLGTKLPKNVVIWA